MAEAPSKAAVEKRKSKTDKKARKFRHAPISSDAKSVGKSSITKPPLSKPAQTVVTIPKKKDDASANWKTISQIIGAGKTKPVVPDKTRTTEKEKTPHSSVKTTSSDKKLDSKGRGMKRTAPKETSVLETTVKKKKVVEEKNEQKEELWFDGVDEILLAASKEKTLVEAGSKTAVGLVKETSFKGLTKTVAMDCEMVGVGYGDESVLARVSLVNHFGHCVYDKYVKPGEKVTDYRTHVSGIRKEDLKNAEEFSVVQQEVKDILRNRTLVGHSLHNDLTVLYIKHPTKKIRDTAKYKAFRALFEGRTPSLKNLSAKLLGISIQTGEHNSVQDAQIAMRLYTMFKKQWESDLKTVKRVKKNPSELKKAKLEREKAQ